MSIYHCPHGKLMGAGCEVCRPEVPCRRCGHPRSASIHHQDYARANGCRFEEPSENYAVPALCLWTIYDHPLDCPDKFVVRQWMVGRNGTRAMLAMSADTLEAARALLPPGLYRLPREENDDPVIVETWI